MAEKTARRSGLGVGASGGLPAPLPRSGASSVIGPVDRPKAEGGEGSEQGAQVTRTAPVVQAAVRVAPALIPVDDSDFPRVSINTRLRFDVKKRLSRVSQERRMSIQSIIEHAVIGYLDELEGGESS